MRNVLRVAPSGNGGRLDFGIGVQLNANCLSDLEDRCAAGVAMTQPINAYLIL